MIELPEAHTLAAQLTAALKGRRIHAAQAAASPHGFAFYSGDPAAYGDMLSGRAIGATRAFAGHVEIGLEGLCLRFFDGVNPRYLPAGAQLPPKHQLCLRLDDDSHLVCTVQMYGGLMLYLPGDEDGPYYQAAKEKPSPLSDAFDEAYFEKLLSSAKRTLSAKALLATEQRIPGLGNGCLQDILFHAGIHPKTKLSALTDSKTAQLYGSVRETLRRMTEAGGRDTEKNLHGEPGGYKTILSSKTAAYGCPVCGASIVRKAYLGGNVYYCPTCQPE